MGEIFAWKYRIRGRVQGVGFRPFARRLAISQGIYGQATNDNNGFTIIVDATERTAMDFLDSLKSDAPPLSIIIDVHIEQLPPVGFTAFDIVESSADVVGHIFLSPDHALCVSCRSDLRDSTDRRHQYGFTTCLNCGPRYSIQSDIPYDRVHTSMIDLAMCTSCHAEYDDPDHRRAHSQTNSCPDCKIPLHLYRNEKEILGTESELVDALIDVLRNDGIVAIKGLSGYLLCCNATSEKAIHDLRQKKHRPSKPFAVMYRDVEMIQADYNLSVREKDMLESSIAPVVLLNPINSKLPEFVAPRLSRIGVFLPSTALLQMILDRCDFPIIATSGNVTNEPLQYKDQDAIYKLKDIAELVMTYDREIIMPQDDSVVQFSSDHQQKIIIRRARGMAPEHIGRPSISEDCVYAFGADMKNTMTIQSKHNIYISQYLGDGSNFDTQERIHQVRNHFSTILKERPTVILADAHPGYQTRNLAAEYAGEVSAEIHYIQHHKAHFAALIEEQDLWNVDDIILGVIWDGTGYGEDDQVWGGEFMEWDGAALERRGHIGYTPILAGDKMSKEPRLSALSFCNGIDIDQSLLKEKFTDVEWKTYNQLLKTAEVQTSSIGRLFDAVASILGLADINQYEGHAAMILESLARQYQPTHTESAYPINDNLIIECNGMIKGILDDLKSNINPSLIAYQFHLTLVRIIEKVAVGRSVKVIGCSGGVFQNALLVDLLIKRLGDSFKLYFHEAMSPNDENISFGQLAYYNRILKDRNG